jgi:hypothetical protein
MDLIQRFAKIGVCSSATMKFRDLFRVAADALGRNKMRSTLTTIGITIGIGAVICTVAIGKGGTEQIKAQLASLGENLVWVEAGGRNVQGVRTGNASTKTLVLDDAKAILQNVPIITGTSPECRWPHSDRLSEPELE